jgi:hypothetical protein
VTTLFILDVEDFRPLARAAGELPGVTVGRRGPYLTVSSATAFEIERAATGCRSAIWYSSVAAIQGGRVARWDRAALRIEPLSNSAGHGG